MPTLKKGDSWIHYGFADGRHTNKLQARNVRLSAQGDRLTLDLRHYQRPRGDLSDSDYRLMITTGAKLTSAVISDETVRKKLSAAGTVLQELVVLVSPTITLTMPISVLDLESGFLKR